MATDPRRTALRALPAVWSLALALVLLGPALAPGYVLSYDMVWVPDLALRPDFLGLGSGLPRAVPSDAVVAVLDEVLPGMLLQKLVLVGMLTAGGSGRRGSGPAAADPGSLRWPRRSTCGTRTSSSGWSSATGPCSSATRSCRGWWSPRGGTGRADACRPHCFCSCRWEA